MLVKDVMTAHVRGIAAEQSVREAAEVMEQLRIGSVPVFRDGQPIGIVTDRDIVVRAVATGCDCSQKPVVEVMSSNLVTTHEDTPIEVVADEMERLQIRRVLVTGGASNGIVGIVSIGDIVAKSGKHALSAELIEKISIPAEPTRIDVP